MPRAQLTLSIPEGIWIGDLTREYPAVRVRILAALADDGLGVGLAELSATSLDEFLDAMAAADDVTALEVLQRSEGEALVQFETSQPLLLLPLQGSGVPLETPFTIRNGDAEMEVTAPQERLSTLGNQLEQFGISFTVEVLRQRIEREQLLTDRQQTLVEHAVEAGYYDTPRECTLTELAERMEMAKSTCSETLHRAEEAIVKRYVETAHSAFGGED